MNEKSHLHSLDGQFLVIKAVLVADCFRVLWLHPFQLAALNATTETS